MLCTNPCGGSLVLPASYIEGCEGELLNVDPDGLAIALCDHQFTSLSQAQIDAAKTANKLRRLPTGLVTMTPQTGQKIKIGCNKYRPGNTTWQIEYKSYDLETGIEMYEFFADIYKLNQYITLLWPNCQGLWFLNESWTAWQNAGAAGPVPTDPLGYTASFVEPPTIVPDDANEVSYWRLLLELKYSGVFVPCELTVNI